VSNDTALWRRLRYLIVFSRSNGPCSGGRSLVPDGGEPTSATHQVVVVFWLRQRLCSAGTGPWWQTVDIPATCRALEGTDACRVSDHHIATRCV
jgi:hypothetical protein